MPDPALVLAVCLVALAITALVLIVHAARAAKAETAAALVTPASGKQVASIDQASGQKPADPSLLPTGEATPEGPQETSTLTNEEKRDPALWKRWPVIPEFTPGAQKIYAAGLKLGNNPRAFSKVGDCESSATWFLEDYDKGEGWYSLGDYSSLQDAIGYFAGSFGRTSLAARDGARVSSLFSPLWADRASCGANETPLECEYRLHKPSFALISIGTNDIDESSDYEGGLRKVIQLSIDKGVVPILTTKADDIEGSDRNNATLAKLAVEYDLPVWNFWAAVQDLPGGGLDTDGSHLTWGDNYFDQPDALQTGWAMRNLTALQVLQSMMKGVYALNLPQETPQETPLATPQETATAQP